MDYAQSLLSFHHLYITGGALLIAIDQAGLGDAALVDSGLTTLDDLMARIVQDEVFQPLQGR